MDRLTFISKMTEALAWPLVALIIVLVFKRRLLALVPSLRKLSLPGGVEAEFESKLERLEIEPNPLAVESELADPGVTVAPTATTAPVDAMALRANPTGVVMEKWKEVEAAARNIILRSTDVNRLFVSAMNSLQIGRELRRGNLLTLEQIEWFNELRALRNLAAHSQETIPAEQVERYVALADQFIRSIAMTQTITFAIHSQQDDGTDGVRFTVMVRRGGETWEYPGTASRSALLSLGAENDLQVIFDANRAKFVEGVKRTWQEQPETAVYRIDSANVHEGGGFVNNG